MVRENSVNLDGLGRFVNREVGSVGEAVQQSEADVVIAYSAGERVLFYEGKLLLKIEIKFFTEAFGATVIIVDGFLDLLKCFRSDLELIAVH